MPLGKIRRKQSKVSDDVLGAIIQSIQPVAAEALMCAEGGYMKAEDIIVEVDEVGPHDRNVKDVNIRIIAHDYPGRRANLDRTRELISREVVKHLPAGVSWYVWVQLMPTSYGSDTE